ncbi:MAG: hypothetical protein EOM80_16260 [Erysipelotrichia bacterium]|nr:hypothetical protein [Erysipelotrichia bacterium]
MKKVKFNTFPDAKLRPCSSCYKAGPEGLLKLDKKWSDNFRVKSRSKRIIFSTGASCKSDRIKELRIRFVLMKNS